jgi:DNA-binding CsgD family transcriptional regulator
MVCTSPHHVDRVRARAGVAAIDTLLEVLEQHLRDDEAATGMPPQWREVLEASGLAVPGGVAGATTIIQLHERLLDWQERLLNAAYPRRGPGARELRRREAHRWLLPSRRPAPRAARPAREHRVEARPAIASTPAPAPPLPSAAEDGLTDREIAVLRIVAEGLTNAQAARRLHLSEHTVAAHLRSIYRKVGVSSRAAATRYAIERGLT